MDEAVAIALVVVVAAVDHINSEGRVAPRLSVGRHIKDIIASGVLSVEVGAHGRQTGKVCCSGPARVV